MHNMCFLSSGGDFVFTKTHKGLSRDPFMQVFFPIACKRGLRVYDGNAESRFKETCAQVSTYSQFSQRNLYKMLM